MPKDALRRRARTAVSRVRATAAALEANSAAFESRLVWVFGSPRSGSTWLLKVLSGHDAVVPINEPLIGWYLGPFLSDLPGGDATALDSSTFTLRRVQADQYAQFFSEHFSDIWVPALARMMRQRFHAHAQRHRPEPSSNYQVLIKEPNGSQSADVIMRALPRAKLLFLLRDGRDVVDSELASNLPGSWVSREFPGLRGIDEEDRLSFVTQSAHKWLWRTEVVQSAFADHRGPKHLVRYEDLLREPGIHVRQILEWMGLKPDESEIAGWLERSSLAHVAGTAPGPREFARLARPGAWRENLRDDEQAVVQDLLGAKLRELGYEV